VTRLTPKSEARATIAAVQHVEGNRWGAATFGDSSILVISAGNEIEMGYGESYGDWKRAGKPLYKALGDDKMDTSVGLSRPGLEPQLYSGRFGPTFGEFEVGEGDRIVVASDAYLQKSTVAVLMSELRQPAEEWSARHSDDTTLAIIDPAILVD